MKRLIKSVLKLIGCYESFYKIYADVRPVIDRLPQIPGSFLWWVYNYIIAYIPCHPFRLFCLRHILGIKIGKGCFIHLGAMFCPGVQIGDYCVIGRNVLFSGPVILGNNISVSAGTWFIGASHDKNSEVFAGTYDTVVIEDYVWTGMRSIVLPGVRVGMGCILGAHAVVTKSPPRGQLLADARLV